VAKINGFTCSTGFHDDKSMRILGSTGAGSSVGQPGFALGVDTAKVVQKVGSVREARRLPAGSIVGDLHGGLTFTDAVAAALESRSFGGWQEVQTSSGETWTIILLNR
jgi:hypothetical protein